MQKGNTKERLIMAALELFSVKGYEGTTVEEIARYVGIKAPTMYKYLKGKEELLQELTKKADEDYGKGMAQSMQGAEEISSGEALKEFALSVIRFTISNDMTIKMRRLFTIEQYRNDLFSELATRHQILQMCSMFADIFRRLMADGILVSGDPEIIALEFTAPVTLMIQMSDRQPEKRDEAMETISKHFDSFIERYFISEPKAE